MTIIRCVGLYRSIWDKKRADLLKEAMAKLHVTLLDHKETAKMAIHNHKSNIPIAETKLVYIDEDIEENQQVRIKTKTSLRIEET